MCNCIKVCPNVIVTLYFIIMIIKNYFSNLKLSISSVNYYGYMLSKPLRTSFFFFIISMIVIGIIRGTHTSLIELPNIKNNVYLALDELENNFDANLEIIWSDNQLEMNRDNLNIYWPSTINPEHYSLPKIIATISNSEILPNESELLENNDLLVYINKNNLYTLQSQNGEDKKNWAEYPLNEIFIYTDSYSINKQNLPKIILGIKEIIDQSFKEIQLIAIIFSAIFFIISRIWFLITESILVYFLFKIYTLIGTRGLDFSFKKILKLGLNILAPAEIIHLVSSIFYKDLNLPMDSIAFWVILTFISFNLRKVVKKA